MTAPLWPHSWVGIEKLFLFRLLARQVGDVIGSNQGHLTVRTIRGSPEGPQHVVRA